MMVKRAVTDGFVVLNLSSKVAVIPVIIIIGVSRWEMCTFEANRKV